MLKGVVAISGEEKTHPLSLDNLPQLEETSGEPLSRFFTSTSILSPLHFGSLSPFLLVSLFCLLCVSGTTPDPHDHLSQYFWGPLSLAILNSANVC